MPLDGGRRLNEAADVARRAPSVGANRTAVSDRSMERGRVAAHHETARGTSGAP